MNRIKRLFKSFKVKLFFIIFLTMITLVILTTITMYLVASRSLMHQAASITETNISLEVDIVNSVFHNLGYCGELMASSEQLIAICSEREKWDYQETTEKYRLVKSLVDRYTTSLQKNALVDNNFTVALFICDQNMVFDTRSTFYENVEWNNVPFLKDYEENYGHWISTVRADGVNLYQSDIPSKYRETMISRSFSIYDANGKLAGVLAAQVSSSVFENYFSDTQKGLAGETIVIDERGIPVLYSDSELYNAFSSCELSVFEMESKWRTLQLNEIEYMLIAGDIENIDAKIFIFIPMTNILQNISMLKRYLLLICMIVFAVSIFATIVISRYFYRPIDTLKKNMHQVKAGNLAVKITDIRKDEFQDIFDTFNNMTYRLESLIQEVAEEKLLNETAELRLLQEQLNPHFLYNTLDSIYSIARINKVYQIAEIVAALSRFFRVSLSNGKNIVTMEEAIDIARNYLIIQNIRFGDRIKYFINIEDGLAQIQVPKLIVQPIVENSIYHGIERKKGGGMISIHAYFQNGECCLSVEDNGVGMEKEQLEEIRNKLYSDEECQYYAVRNLAKQLRILYKGAETFTIDSQYGKGTCVTIVIPIKEVDKEIYDKVISS